MWYSTKPDLKMRWNSLKTPKTLCITLLLFMALCGQSAFAQRGSIRAGNGIKEKRDSTLTFLLDTAKVDSTIKAIVSDTATALRAGGMGGGRTYVSLNPFAYMNALRILDSADQNYILFVPYAIQSFSGYRNFANGANDSALVQNVAGSYSLIPPSIFGEYITFVNVNVRTTYGTAAVSVQLFDNVVQVTADTCIFSANLVCRTTGGVRNYWIRIYKHYTSSFSGINPPLTGGTLVASANLGNTLFPNAVTSTYALVSIGYRRLQ